MSPTEAAGILGVDMDAIDDLEDILGIDGSWTIADLQRAADVLDDDAEDE